MTVTSVPASSAAFLAPANGRGLIAIPQQNSDGSVTTSPNFTTQVTMSEHHHDEVEIVQHPIEIGSPITDHAFLKPSELTLNLIYVPPNGGSIGPAPPSATYLNHIYDQLLLARSNRILFTVSTTRRVYTPMLIKSITVETDNTKQNILEIVLQMQQILLVSTTLSAGGVTAQAANQTFPADTNPPQPVGVVQPILLSNGIAANLISVQTPYQIPLINAAQQMQIVLAGIQYALTMKWNSNASSWVLDIADVNNVLLVGSIPLVTGCDLLGQYGYLGFGGQLVAATDFDPTVPPTYADLGNTGTLTFITTP